MPKRDKTKTITRSRDHFLFLWKKKKRRLTNVHQNYIVKYIAFKIFYVYSTTPRGVKSTIESDLRAPVGRLCPTGTWMLNFCVFDL